MASVLALFAAFLFALAAALQQKGALNLAGVSLAKPMSLVRLAGQRTWLIGTVALLIGYAFQAAALDRGRLAIIQPLLVTTVVFALPLGVLLTNQHVGRRELGGAAVILLGLGLFAVFGDPAGGKENAPGDEWAVAIVVLGAAQYAGRGVTGFGLSNDERHGPAADFGPAFRARFGKEEGAPLPIKVRRGTDTLTLNAKVRLAVRLERRIEADPAASPKAVRIRTGILKGITGH